MTANRQSPRQLGQRLSALVGAAFCAALFIMAISQARAASSTTWIASRILASPDGTSRILWIDSTANGDKVWLWKMNSSGYQIAASQIYGPFSDANGIWTAYDIAVAADGSTRLLWTETGTKGTAVDIWTFNSALQNTASGPPYGPYKDATGAWMPNSIVAAPSGVTTLLWTKDNAAGTAASVWTFDAKGSEIASGPAYGPYKDGANFWTPQQLELAPDSTPRLLWTDDGTTSTGVSIWAFNNSGTVVNYGPAYGPYANWYISNFDTDPVDGTLRLLWYSPMPRDAGDTASVWSLTSKGLATAMGPAYSPGGGWEALNTFANSDGTSSIEWGLPDPTAGDADAISVWTLNSVGSVTKYSPAYGPYSGWQLYDYDRDISSGDLRLLWNRTEGAASMWSLDQTGGSPARGPAIGPYAGS